MRAGQRLFRLLFHHQFFGVQLFFRLDLSGLDGGTRGGLRYGFSAGSRRIFHGLFDEILFDRGRMRRIREHALRLAMHTRECLGLGLRLVPAVARNRFAGQQPAAIPRERGFDQGRRLERAGGTRRSRRLCLRRLRRPLAAVLGERLARKHERRRRALAPRRGLKPRQPAFPARRSRRRESPGRLPARQTPKAQGRSPRTPRSPRDRKRASARPGLRGGGGVRASAWLRPRPSARPPTLRGQ